MFAILPLVCFLDYTALLGFSYCALEHCFLSTHWSTSRTNTVSHTGDNTRFSAFHTLQTFLQDIETFLSLLTATVLLLIGVLLLMVGRLKQITVYAISSI
mgnify:CR=1 FL=1